MTGRPVVSAPTDETARKLQCINDYRMFRFGDVILGERPTSISEDDLNFYWHDVNDDNGFAKSNYLTLPKYAFAARREARDDG